MKHIHLVAICGVGMAPLAVMLKDSGYRVSGSDRQSYPPMGDVLKEAGISVTRGFAAANLEARPDLVIVGNAVVRTNPEAMAVEELGIEKISFPAALSRFYLGGKQCLVVAGTHGKTTTTGMLAHVLQTAGLDPGYLIGGLVRDFDRLARPAGGPYFVVEGDEYDSAYFDKRPKFIHYNPAAAIITSVEFDHADIYADLEAVKVAFAQLVSLLAVGAPLLGCGDWPDLREVVERGGSGVNFISYGSNPDNDWSIEDLRHDGATTAFDCTFRGRREERLQLSLPGRMNALNALAVYALGRELGVNRQALGAGLASYRGVARRQEVVGEVAGITVVDDFAHHPTAVAATIAAVKDRWPGRPLRAVFEPRSNTSRRAIFQQRYGAALAAADRVVVSAVYAKENDPLADHERLCTATLVAGLEAAAVPAWSADGPEAILERLLGEVESGEVVLVMSNGAFGGLARRLVEALSG